MLLTFPSSGEICGLLITFAYSLDQDYARQNSGLISIQTDTLMDGVLKIFFENVNFEDKIR